MTQESRSIVLRIPDDPALQAAFGRVSLRHSHLDHILRMTIKTLADVSVAEGLDATVGDSSSKLRDRIRKMARQRLGEGSALVKLQALLSRCKRATSKRNDYVHSVWAWEVDGDHKMSSQDHAWRDVPTVATLDALANEITALTNELNEGRFAGFLAEALRKTPV